MFMKNLFRDVFGFDSRAAAGGLDMIANQNLRNLDSVESRAFAQIVRDDPEIEAVGHGIVLADSPHVGCILANGLNGHGVDVVFRLIRNNDAWSLAQYGFDIRYGEFFLRLDVDGLRMAAKNWNPNRGRSDSQRGFAENFARLVNHLQLFFGVTAINKGIDVRNTIEGNLVWKLLHF